MNAGLWTNATVARVNSFINGIYNTSYNTSYGGGPYIDRYKQDKYDFSFSPSVSYNDNTATISAYSTAYWVFSINAHGSVQLPKKLEIGSTVDVTLRQKSIAFPTNNNVVKWDAYIGKKFAKKDQMEIRANVNDILNQNIGYSRTATGAIITQNSYNTIRRYGMLELIWNFTHTPVSGAAKTDGAIEAH